MTIPGPAQSVGKKVAEYAAFFAIFATVGSYWINTEVERRMEELASDPGKHPTVVELVTEVENIENTVVRVEDKVDAFAGKFLEYLERQSQ